MKGAGKFEASSSKIVFEDSEEHLSCSSVSSSDEEEETEKELTFEEIHKLRADGSKTVPWKPNQVKKTGRANKNRPVELSSKKPVSRYREVVQVPKKEARDPRFNPLGGKLDLEGFRKRYNFFFEDKLPIEREELKKKLKKTKNPEEVNELKNRLTYVEKMLKYEPSTKNKGAAILTEHKKREREAAKEGKKPYYLKKSEIRKQTLIEKYNSLKELTNGGRRMQLRIIGTCPTVEQRHRERQFCFQTDLLHQSMTIFVAVFVMTLFLRIERQMQYDFLFSELKAKSSTKAA